MRNSWIRSTERNSFGSLLYEMHLGTYFSYNNTTKEKSNFLKIVSNLQNVFNFLRFRNFNLEGRIVVFKNQAISRIVFQGQTAPVLSHIILKL